jgi:DNA replication licensing factor MCM4
MGGGENDHNHNEEEENNNDVTFMEEELLSLQQNQSAEVRIWGTEINVHTCRNVFLHFLENFGKKHPTDLLSHYQKTMIDLQKKNQSILNINCSHFKQHPSTQHFYHQLVQFPQDIIPILDIVANESFRKLFPSNDSSLADQEMNFLQVRLFGLEESCRLRSLNPENVEQLIAVKGMVIRVSSIIPDLKMAFFRCSICHHSLSVLIERGRIEEPTACPACQTLSSLEIIHNRCAFSDKQYIRLQETPDEIPEGETPQTVSFEKEKRILIVILFVVLFLIVFYSSFCCSSSYYYLPLLIR